MRMQSVVLTAIMVFLISNSLRASEAAPEYVAHEWGTFTSVQGSDGVLLEWRPLVTSELPEFVYNRAATGAQQQHTKPQAYAKGDYIGNERMETPVLYFYPKNEMTVDVSVQFPQGAITEWYPMVRDFGPDKVGESMKPTGGYLRWGTIRLFPATLYPEFEKDIPTAKSESNYFAARETDAAYVRVGTTRGISKYEHEKFLFYRGVGNFTAPLEVKGGGDYGMILRNLEADPIPAFFVLTVSEKSASYQAGGTLAHGLERNLLKDNAATQSTPSDVADALGKEVAEVLVKQGLYEKEAAAMVKTWRESWFLEKGTRILYILPESWTNRMLPLTLSPSPTELKRVMVGRAELITPELEGKVAASIASLSSTDFDTRENASKSLTGLGRFAEPALQRVIGTTKDPEVKSRAAKLIEEMHAPGH